MRLSWRRAGDVHAESVEIANDAAGEIAPDSSDLQADAPPAPKAGRDLKAASVVGLSLLGLVLVAAWWHPLALAAMLYAFCIGALYEWRTVLRGTNRRIPIVPLVVATVGMGVATWFARGEGLVVALLVGCAGVVAWRIVDERVENTLADAFASMFSLMWIPFLGSFILLLELAYDGWQRVFVLIIAVVGNDTGALYIGKFFGRRKFAPRVSPNKTWEGAVGGVISGTVAAAVAAYGLFDGDWLTGLLVGFVVTIAAIIGDLAESAIKRDISVKDMSGIIPGHGGILDRLDSLLVAAPAAYVVFALLMGTT